MRKRLLAILQPALLVPALAWGQGHPATNVPPGQEQPSLSFASETTPTNVLVGSMTVTGSFDSNAGSATSHPVSDVQLFLSPALAMTETRPHLDWTLSFSPGVGISQHFSDRNQLMAYGGFDIRYRPTVRLNVHLRQDYTISTDPFARPGEIPLLPELGPLVRPNQYAVLPQNKRTTAISLADVGYRLSAHTTVGASGAFTDTRYQSIASSQALAESSFIQNRISTGGAFLSHQFSRTHTGGVQYSLTDMQFPGTGARTRLQTINIFDKISITPHSVVDVFVGSDYAFISNQVALTPSFSLLLIPGSKRSLRPNGGITYTWSADRTALQLEAVHRIDDGGGLSGSTQVTACAAELRRRLSRNLTGDIGGAAANSNPLDVTGSMFRIRSEYAQIGLQHQMTAHISVVAMYQRVHQTEGAPEAHTNHNRVQISFEYHVTKPLAF